MAIMFIRAQMISRGAGRSILSAAAYRHRTTMTDEQTGATFHYEGGASELVHEELALPERTPVWLRAAIDERTIGQASEALWNAVDRFEKRSDAQLAREIIFALPRELTRAENIALVREFVRENLTSKGMISDWVYHDKDGNPHVHLMTTLRPLTEVGFGAKKVAVTAEGGKPLRIFTPDRPKGRIIYRVWAGDKETMKAWKIAWAETANRHLALAGHEFRLDGRSYAEQGLDRIAQKHLGPARTALARKGWKMFSAPAELARRQELADRLTDDPEMLLKQISNERSTFDERDIARALHRYVDDPSVFASIRARVMASEALVMLRPQEIDRRTGVEAKPAIFTTRVALRTEYEMAQTALALSAQGGFAASERSIFHAVKLIESGGARHPVRLGDEQLDAIRYVTGGRAIVAVVGLAGSGKSTLLNAARLVWEADGRRVAGAALSGKAAEGLESTSGIRSRTLAAWELAWAGGRERLGKGDVFVVDEAGMVASQQMARILSHAQESGAKVVLVGDAMQLQPIQAGASFRAIVERTGFAELSGIRRQHKEWARSASRLFARGEVEKALDLYAWHGHLAESETREEAIRRIVADWTDARRQMVENSTHGGDCSWAGDELLVLAHANDDVKRLNDALRKVMVEEGVLGEGCLFETHRGTRDFAVNDRIIFLENARFVEPGARQYGPQHVKNGMLGTVLSTSDEQGRLLLTVRLDSGREIVFSDKTYPNIDHGYATTIHKSQGTTVDRTFVLATGMMDRHLIYVAMSRHRDRADLYAALEDFEQWPERKRNPRADYATGVTGEFTKFAEAKFRPEEEGEPTPYVDVRTDDGTTHRLWGTNLPAALEKSGAALGDTVTLRRDSVEQVTVRVSATDEETGRKRWRECVVERNIWSVEKVESAENRAERIAQKSYRPELFNQLVERLSRSGAKTTTLDYAGLPGYRAYESDFARLRGIDHLVEAASRIEERIARQLAWLSQKRRQVQMLWERACVAVDLVIERERWMADDNKRFRAIDFPTDVARYLLGPATSFVRTVDEDAQLAQLASHSWKKREAALRPILKKIYRNPDTALSILNALVSSSKIDPRELGEDLKHTPEHLGRLCGADYLIDRQTGRRKRAEALKAVSGELVPLARDHAVEFKKRLEHFRVQERLRRSHMALSVPALSARAIARLDEIEAVRNRGGEGAYRTACALAAADQRVVQEVKAVSQALTARFGKNAFTAHADSFAERNMLERMPENVPHEERAKLVELFSSVKRFADERHRVERQDRSLIVAAVPCEAAADRGRPPPMLAGVSQFNVPIEEEARSRALASPLYSQKRAEFTDMAIRIWRDPAAAVALVENQIAKKVSGKRVSSAVIRNPSAYGPLRGSGRMINRLLASGRERKDAVQAVEEADVRLRALGASFAVAFETEVRSIADERRRMAITVPGLTRAARNELTRLTKEAGKRSRALSELVRKLDPSVREEFEAVNHALDARFGRNAFAGNDKKIFKMVPPAQRQDFDLVRSSLRILQQTVQAGRAEKILSERRLRPAEPGRRIDL